MVIPLQETFVFLIPNKFWISPLSFYITVPGHLTSSWTQEGEYKVKKLKQIKQLNFQT